ncbi:MAG: phage major capsid protein [Herbiconiux sp.]|uniref:phage major capsid protein n=1 Tax=Herbiconiux sp. TaxID=1871186 RepID=UPI0011F7407E|nr:phage major capsid protein [Herbiconiux sp.]TAJ46283.1 MAG: phage major capsid protein [Herbiconiux sp.]
MSKTTTTTTIARLEQERTQLWEDKGAALSATASTREFTADEAIAWETVERDIGALDQQLANLRTVAQQDAAIEAFQRELDSFAPDKVDARRWINTDTNQVAALRGNEPFGSHPVAARRLAGRDDHARAMYSGVGEMVRALSTTGGSAIVPTIWSSTLIDLARAKSAVAQAGAAVVPMGAPTVNIGRMTGEPTATFRTEGSAIAPSDPTFDNVTLIAKSLSAQVIGSREWFQDAENADQVVSEAIAKAIAGKIDQVALYGGITAGAGTINLPTPLNPRGILAALIATKPANVLGSATNGTVQTAGKYWDEIIDLLFTVRDSNESPTGLVWNSKLDRMYAKAYDTTGQPLAVPSAVAEVPRFSSNTIPSYTQGTMAGRATDVFAGDWSNLIIGQRLDITLQVLTERYADTGQIGIVAHWRGDIQPARPSAFAVHRAIQGAA